jgi:DNA-binding CsgD family transcriptional regulator
MSNDLPGEPGPPDDGPIALEALLTQIAELFRPGPIDEWRARIDHLVGRWLARRDTRVLWTEADEESARGGTRLVLPGRAQAPRALLLHRPLGPEARGVWNVLRIHLATAVAQMETRFEVIAAQAPLRWRRVLSPRQLEVARLVSDGHSNEIIATQLGVAPRTVVRLVQEVFKKLGCSNRSELAAELALGRPPTPAHQRVPDELRGAVEGPAEASEAPSPDEDPPEASEAPSPDEDR